MAFHGKKWKKTDFENVVELMDALDVPAKTRALLGNTGTTSTFLRNDDGSIQYIVDMAGKELINQKIELGVETDLKTPDGIDAKSTFTLEGETLKAVIKLPDGKVAHMEREFGPDKLTLRVWVEGVDIKATINYASV